VIACFERHDGLQALRVEIFHASRPPRRHVHTGMQELWPTQEVRGAIAWRRADHVSFNLREETCARLVIVWLGNAARLCTRGNAARIGLVATLLTKHTVGQHAHRPIRMDACAAIVSHTVARLSAALSLVSLFSYGWGHTAAKRSTTFVRGARGLHNCLFGAKIIRTNNEVRRACLSAVVLMLYLVTKISTTNKYEINTTLTSISKKSTTHHTRIGRQS
jgi:hypothetical protein